MNKLMIICTCILVLLISSNGYSKEKETLLPIETKSHQFNLSRSKLLSMKNITHVRMNNNRAYQNSEMNYTAIKLCDLLKPYSIKSKYMLEFIAADHFSVLIPASKVMTCNNKSSIAYLAIEPKNKWPLLKNNTGTTAGPFDVIWVNPEKSYISDEYWAWSVVKIKIHESLDKKIFSTAPNVQDMKIRNGYDIYISHCAGCHSINHIGKGVIGPDLNIPMNPVEYYPDDQLLKKFIRDPQSVRVIKNDRMSGSNKPFLSDEDLDNLILYFHYMAKNKIINNNH